MSDYLFKVTTPDGHEYVIYADGRIDGFPDGCSVDSRVPLHVRQEFDRAVQLAVEKRAAQEQDRWNRAMWKARQAEQREWCEHGQG